MTMKTAYGYEYMINEDEANIKSALLEQTI